ncbi:BZ3500_MvSof-1268-A1-R1_Chr4-3g07376 [Microbotryum saponariae]|uniref:BZ3500_MvSof-1268-A1-R1_Chr4-3g07376 protein n=1 Tax=Microbotryum saponariae TaxID=289078 RepID=A0A2X0LM42_9BASI|nr:BZ3500_MvSof-1268-A1-R1_Chr4-3g07376 [Microbotryum saponariae]SDA07039.1 BZ3501_MvSof-1269-A2-R1_Chr4-2g07085 [Microbotryum saponariae]
MSYRKYTHLDPLPTTFDTSSTLPEGTNPDGKSLANDQTRASQSPWYENYDQPFLADGSRSDNVFDFHIYYSLGSKTQVEHAKKLHERIRREFPEFRIYKFWDRAVGPHPIAMFEVNVFTPVQVGALLGFLVAYRGPLSVLMRTYRIHPNTSDALRDHTERATWMGTPIPLITEFLEVDH